MSIIEFLDAHFIGLSILTGYSITAYLAARTLLAMSIANSVH